MSLMHLLTVGRSFGSVEDRPSPYRMVQENLLPKFGPTDRSESKLPPVEVGSAVAPGGPSMRSGGADGSKRSEIKMNPIETQAPPAPDASSAFPPQAYPLGRWTLLRNPFHRPTASRKGPNFVQGELSLASVRPVRNDLNESDLIIIPASVAPAGVSDEPASMPRRGGVMAFLWRRLRTCFSACLSKRT